MAKLIWNSKLPFTHAAIYPAGFQIFNASGNYARENSVDYIIHLGDYIYEDKNGDNGLSATK